MENNEYKPEERERRDRYTITEMPTKEVLEEFLRSKYEDKRLVYFDTETGTFKKWETR